MVGETFKGKMELKHLAAICAFENLSSLTEGALWNVNDSSCLKELKSNLDNTIQRLLVPTQGSEGTSQGKWVFLKLFEGSSWAGGILESVPSIWRHH